METLHEDLFRDVDAEDEADLYDQVPESSCTGPRKSCARCQELGRRCYRCRRNKNTRIDETPPKKSSLELILGSAASRRRSPIDETPPEPTRTTKDTPTRARPQEATRDTRTTYLERTYTSHSTYRSEYDSWSRSTSRSGSTSRLSRSRSFSRSTSSSRTRRLSSMSRSRSTRWSNKSRSSSRTRRSNSMSEYRRTSRSERRHEPRRRRSSSYTRLRSRHRYYRHAEESQRRPRYRRSDVQFEVLKTCAGWQLLSTKCHVEELTNGRRTHYHEHRHLGGPFTDPSRCNTCRWLPTEDITFKNVKVTYIRKAPIRGYAKEVWSAMIGEPLPMRGLVIHSTWYNSGPLRVRRNQMFGPGRLMDRLSGPSDSDLSLEDVVNYLYRVCKSIYYALRHCIFGIYPAGDGSHELD